MFEREYFKYDFRTLNHQRVAGWGQCHADRYDYRAAPGQGVPNWRKVSTTDRPGLRSESVRRRNLSTILRLLHIEGPLSRSAIGDHTGLTRTSIGTLVSDLVEMNFVDEALPEPDGTPGRPSPVVRPLADRNAVIGVDLMVDSIGVAAIGLGGTTLRSVRRDRPRRQQSAQQTIEEVSRIVEQVRSTLAPSTRVFGMGVAVPGAVSSADQRLVVAPNLRWTDVDIRGMLRPTVPDLPIHVANEADLGALAESRRGAVAGRSHVLYLSGEVGLGGGIISDGKLVRGRGGFAGEIGHLPVNPNGGQCRCGAHGCLETEVGEEALLRRAGLDPNGGRQAIEALLQAAADGDPETLRALEEHAHWLAIGITGLVNVLDVEVVVLGGLLSVVFPYIDTHVSGEFSRRVLQAMSDTTIVASALGEDSTLLGAGELAWDSVLTDPIAAAEAEAVSDSG